MQSFVEQIKPIRLIGEDDGGSTPPPDPDPPPLPIARLLNAFNANGAPLETEPVDTAASGSSFLVLLWSSAGAVPALPEDNKGNEYVAIGGPLTGGGGKATAFLAANAIGGDDHQFLLDSEGSTPNWSIITIELLNCDADPFDAAAAREANDEDAPYEVTSGTLARRPSLVIALCGSGSGGILTWEALSGVLLAALNDGNTYWPAAASAQVVESTDPVTASFNCSASAHAQIILPFKGLTNP